MIWIYRSIIDGLALVGIYLVEVDTRISPRQTWWLVLFCILIICLTGGERQIPNRKVK